MAGNRFMQSGVAPRASVRLRQRATAGPGDPASRNSLSLRVGSRSVVGCLVGFGFGCAALVGTAHAEPQPVLTILSVDCGGKTNATLGAGDTVTISLSYNRNETGSNACIVNNSFACVSNTVAIAAYTRDTPISLAFALTGAFPSPAMLRFGDTVGSTALQCPAPLPSQSQKSADLTQQVTTTFLDNRVNQLISNDPGNVSLSQRNNGTGGTANAGGLGFANKMDAGTSSMGLGRPQGAPWSFAGSRLGQGDDDAPGQRPMQFRTSLSEMARMADRAKAAQEREAGVLGLSATGTLAAQRAPSPLDIWLEGRYIGFNDDAARLDRKGVLGIVYLGADYLVHPNILVGALVQQDWASDGSAVLRSDVDGRGWMAGPYISMRLLPAIFLDMRAAWGRSSNDITVGTATGSFDTDRWLAKAKLIGNWQSGAWRLTPSVEVAHVEEQQKAFANSGGTLVPEQAVALSRATFGPEIGYKLVLPGQYAIEPFASVMGLWDFNRPNAPILNGLVVDADGFRGRVEAGFTLLASPGWYLRAAGGYDGIGSGTYHAYTLQGVINVPLN
jgi:outer membrane autotransporter protein